MKVYLGIDPGKTGAVAFIDGMGQLMKVVDFPDVMSVDWFAEDFGMAYLEEVHAMPGQGVASTFTFGTNFGWWKGFLTAMRIPFKTIRPQDWQKGLVPKRGAMTDKPSLEVARQLFPHAPLTRKKDHNRADAILIAHKCFLVEAPKN